MPIEPGARSAGKPVHMEVTKDHPTGLEPPVLESTTYPTEAILESSGPEFELSVPEPIVWLFHVGTAQVEVLLSSEPELSIPEPNIQPTPTSVESFQLVPSHAE